MILHNSLSNNTTSTEWEEKHCFRSAQLVSSISEQEHKLNNSEFYNHSRLMKDLFRKFLPTEQEKNTKEKENTKDTTIYNTCVCFKDLKEKAQAFNFYANNANGNSPWNKQIAYLASKDRKEEIHPFLYGHTQVTTSDREEIHIPKNSSNLTKIISAKILLETNEKTKAADEAAEYQKDRAFIASLGQW
jgi:hypothetical protein